MSQILQSEAAYLADCVRHYLKAQDHVCKVYADPLTRDNRRIAEDAALRCEQARRELMRVQAEVKRIVAEERSKPSWLDRMFGRISQ